MVPKPSLLLEVEAALDAAEKARAELEAFDKSAPDLSLLVQGNRAILQALKAILNPALRQPVGYVTLPWPVLVLINEAILRQEEVLEPINKKWNEREALAAKAYDSGRAYVYASHKWDSSAERWDYLQTLAAPSAQE